MLHFVHAADRVPQPITLEGRKKVMEDPTGAAFPWNAKAGAATAPGTFADLAGNIDKQKLYVSTLLRGVPSSRTAHLCALFCCFASRFTDTLQTRTRRRPYRAYSRRSPGWCALIPTSSCSFRFPSIRPPRLRRFASWALRWHRWAGVGTPLCSYARTGRARAEEREALRQFAQHGIRRRRECQADAVDQVDRSAGGAPARSRVGWIASFVTDWNCVAPWQATDASAAPVATNFVSFQRVSNLTIFIENNQG